MALSYSFPIEPVHCSTSGLSVASSPAYRFLKIEVRQSGIPISPQFVVIYTVKGFGIVNKAEVDVFLELPCFFSSSADVCNLICGSSAFSKTSLNIWKFAVHVLLKPGLENFEHHFTAAAKSLQSCPTLCNPTDSSPQGSPFPGILQARTLEWVAISFSNA